MSTADASRSAEADAGHAPRSPSQDGSLVYCHRLRRGVNRESHGLQVAALAEMPPAALDVARATLAWLAHEKEQEQPPARGAAQRLAGGERRMLALDARLASAPVAAALSNTA